MKPLETVKLINHAKYYHNLSNLAIVQAIKSTNTISFNLTKEALEVVPKDDKFKVNFSHKINIKRIIIYSTHIGNK